MCKSGGCRSLWSPVAVVTWEQKRTLMRCKWVAEVRRAAGRQIAMVMGQAAHYRPVSLYTISVSRY